MKVEECCVHNTMVEKGYSHSNRVSSRGAPESTLESHSTRNAKHYSIHTKSTTVPAPTLIEPFQLDLSNKGRTIMTRAADTDVLYEDSKRDRFSQKAKASSSHYNILSFAAGRLMQA